MDRNDFFQTLFAPTAKKNELPQNPLSVEASHILESPPFTTGIAPYAGTWTENEAIHLLKRLCFGAPREDVVYMTGLSYTAAVDELLNTVNTASNIGEPIKAYSSNTVSTPADDPDWGVPMGNSWVNTGTNSGSINSLRRDSLKAWWLNNLISQPRSIEEKMILFWSTHFAIEFDTVSLGTLNYDYVKTLRQYALGNFKAFTKAITLNPAMLIYLNGYLNTKTAPDENYGRELQELFTMGKGPDSLYTESDVKAAARVLTGYQVNKATVTSYFTASRHDTNAKQFSPFYNNTIINRPIAEGEQELDDLLTMIFNTNESAKYICRRLYRFFVYDDISADTETNIITPLATTFRANNYEIKPVLAQLFKSEHFFDALQYGGMIKSPADFAAGLIRECKVKLPPASNPLLRFKHVGYLSVTFLSSINESLGDPPNVSGFAAYYQTPLFDKIWIDTDTFSKRQNLINTLVNGGYSSGNFKTFIDVVDFARRMSNPSDPNQLVLDFNKYLFRRTLSQGLRDTIKTDILLTGQVSDHYWSDAWNAYVNIPSDLNNYSVVNGRLKTLVQYFLSKLEEYQLM